MPRAQLVELYARRLGVIDEAHIEFGPGFNVLTGETGAGKTLLLGALELCLGSDAAASRYAVSSDSRAVAVFVRDDGLETVLAREATASGRLRATLDAVPSSAEALRQVATDLIVIHGQHDSLALRSRSEILAIIDHFGEVDVHELVELRRKIVDLRRESDDLGGDRAQREREIGVLNFQYDELTRAALLDGEELDRVLEELSHLSTMRDAQSELLSVVDLLDGDHDSAVLSQFARAVQRLPRGVGIDDVREELSVLLENARAQVHEVMSRAQPDNFDPGHLEQLEARATILQQLARKYGGSLESAIVQRDEIGNRLTFVAGAMERRNDIELQLQDCESQLASLMAKVRLAREEASNELSRRVKSQLPRVALPHASLRFEVQGDDGSQAQLLFTANPGWPEGPLQALASGGELSRVLLALSLETAHADVVAVFDEIDAGVGGLTAQQIGECLREVAEVQQVIAITHLASVAAQAAHHFVIEKAVSGGVTSTRVRALDKDERVREIARMLAGNADSDEAHALARRLLESSK